jgi:hypothetical protein
MQIQTKYSCGSQFFIRYSNEFRLVEVTGMDIAVRKCELDPADREIKITYSLKGVNIVNGGCYTVGEKDTYTFEEANALLSSDYIKSMETLSARYMDTLKTIQPLEE